MNPSPSKPLSLSPLGPVLLLVVSAAESLLALYQWMELLWVRSGGTAVCSLNATVNCATVWNSPFAARIHSWLGMPVAGLGLVWGLTGLLLTVALVHRLLSARPAEVVVGALQVVAAIGLFSCITFAVGSLKAGAVCLTCLATFALVLAFNAVAFRLLPLQPASGQGFYRALLAAAVTAAACYLALLYPGYRTPHADGPLAGRLGDADKSSADPQAQLTSLFESLSPAEKQAVSDARAMYLQAPTPPISRFHPRVRFGPDDAPMKLVEFTDLRCSHCKSLVELLHQLKDRVPAGKLSIEPRQFPRDASCNKLMQPSPDDGLSCLGAKAQICLEGAPDFWELREKLFDAQESLTEAKVLEIASSGSVKLEQLQACIASPETQAKINDDLSYAVRFQPKGTPLVLVNGKESPSTAAWLYALALSGGNPQALPFDQLPPPGP